MALKLLQGKSQPYGQFDCLDADLPNFKGGEVASFTYLQKPTTDQAAADVGDGYVSYSAQKRPAVTKSLVSGMRPLFLVDDGIAGYGTMFGQVVGGATGQQVTGGVVLGPSTATGSGKVTLWDGPGMYGVTLDAVDTTSTTGLQPTNTTLAGNAPLYATAAGLLTPNVSAAFESVVVGHFIEFNTTGSLVRTPNSLRTALNVPSGSVQSSTGNSFVQATIYFNPGN